MAEYIATVTPYGRGQRQVSLTDEEIVRCRDCRFFDTRKCKSQWPFVLDAYCFWGERR